MCFVTLQSLSSVLVREMKHAPCAVFKLEGNWESLGTACELLNSKHFLNLAKDFSLLFRQLDFRSDDQEGRTA